jgi:hypothetical protein
VTIYQQGQKVRVPITVTDINGVLTNATLAGTLTKPDYTSQDISGSIVNDSTGNYHVDIDTSARAGNYLVLITTSGTVTVAYDSQFYARPTGFQIVGLGETKEHLNKSKTVVTDDNELRGFIDTAGDIVEEIVGPVRPQTVIEYHNGGSQDIFLRTWPVISVTSVVETWWGGTNFTLNQETDLGVGGSTGYDFTFEQETGKITRRRSFFAWRFVPGVNNIKVTGLAGRAQPWRNDLRLAAMELVGHLWRNSQLGRGPSRVAVGGEDTVVVAGISYSVPTRVIEMLQGEKRPPQAAAL